MKLEYIIFLALLLIVGSQLLMNNTNLVGVKKVKSLVEKVEVLEQLVGLITDCANRKMKTKQITDYIDNLY